MSKKQQYLESCKNFLEAIAQNHNYQQLPGGVFYKVLQSGNSTLTPSLNSVVSVHYVGRLITGKEFDNSYLRGCPEALRLTEVIEGWQIALQNMHIGDKWEVVIPAEKGYGKRSNGPIPGGSVLTFEIELLSIC